VLGDATRIGRLRPGYAADVVLLDAPDWRYLAYHVGVSLVRHVFVDGTYALGDPEL
jgi:imidazolonepropionase